MALQGKTCIQQSNKMHFVPEKTFQNYFKVLFGDIIGSSNNADRCVCVVRSFNTDVCLSKGNMKKDTDQCLTLLEMIFSRNFARLMLLLPDPYLGMEAW